MLPVSTIQPSTATRFTSLQQREVHGLKLQPSLCHLRQSNQWTPPWLNAWKSVLLLFVAHETEGLSSLFCLLCFPLWKDTFKLKHLDQRYRTDKVSHQWHFFDHLRVKLKLFLMIPHLTCRSNVNTVCELTNKFVAGRKEDRTKIPLVLWYH